MHHNGSRCVTHRQVGHEEDDVTRTDGRTAAAKENMTTIEGVGKLQDAFEVQGVLGCGAYGRVFLAKIKQSGQVSDENM